MPQRIPRPAQTRPPDPLGRPLALPSGGMLYGSHDGTVIISPMRGEQEEIIAGAGDGLAATPALRHVVSQCVDLRGIPYEGLELSDWSAILLHVLALSLGEDNIPLYPTCPVCKVQFDGSRSLANVPCRVIRRAQQGEDVTWPPETPADEDEDLRVLREMGLDTEGAARDAQQVFVTNAIEEPVEIVLSNQQRIGWRYLRLADLIMAEEFAEKAQAGTDTSTPAGKLHSFIHARTIASIDGKRVGALEAMRFVKQAPLPLLSELRLGGERRSFGYELSPSFRCPSGHSFRQQLPLNGAMFRRRLGSAVR